jgi:hypothetical protein
MISLLDPAEREMVLRPTVYQPDVGRLRDAEKTAGHPERGEGSALRVAGKADPSLRSG